MAASASPRCLQQGGLALAACPRSTLKHRAARLHDGRTPRPLLRLHQHRHRRRIIKPGARAAVDVIAQSPADDGIADHLATPYCEATVSTLLPTPWRAQSKVRASSLLRTSTRPGVVTNQRPFLFDSTQPTPPTSLWPSTERTSISCWADSVTVAQPDSAARKDRANREANRRMIDPGK